MQQLLVRVDQSHHFRYPSEWDPRKQTSNSKGGFLEGEIRLPSFENCSEMELVISICAAVDAGGPSDDILDEFHPNMLHVARWKGKNRDRTKETVPDPSHWKVEFIVRKERNKTKLFINNSKGDNDHDKDVPEEEFLFEIRDSTILLGKGANKLSLIILQPKTDQRSSETDISLSRVLDKRIPEDEERRRKIKEKYLRDGLSTVKLKFEVTTKENFLSIFPSNVQCHCHSGIILNKADKKVGSLDIKYVRPMVSCSLGRREIMIVTEQPAKDVMPVLQCFDHLDHRDMNAELYLQQPNQDLVIFDNQYVTRFTTPPQPSIDMILNNNLTIKVFLKRENGSLSYSGKEIQYRAHNNAYNCLCNVEDIDGITESSSLPEKTAPGRKRRLATIDSSDQDQGQSHGYTVVVDKVECSQVNIDECSQINIDGIEETWAKEEQVIAQSPYSSTLNTPETHHDDVLYLHSMPSPPKMLPKEIFQVDGPSGRGKGQLLPRNIGDVSDRGPRKVSVIQRAKRYIIKRVFKDDPQALEVFGTESSEEHHSIQEKLDIVFKHFPHLPALFIMIMAVFYFIPEMATFANCAIIFFCTVISIIL